MRDYVLKAQAPGKVFLWGEYAVLQGAPAAVMAIDRRVTCRLTRSEIFRFSASGFSGQSAAFKDLPARSPTDASAARLPWQVQSRYSRTDKPAALHLDTAPFFQGRHKLGLGSSAALTVAVEGVWARWMSEDPNLDRALAAHRALQGGKGSGADVAVAWRGGVSRWQDGQATPAELSLPPYRFVWTGQSAATGDHIGRFSAWLKASGDGANPPALADLTRTSEQLFNCFDLDALADYVRALKRLDAAANLGIYAGGHAQLESLAERFHLAYKPCGAGGGDLGVAFSNAPDAFAPFEAAAVAAGFTIIDCKADPNGLHIFY